MGRDSWRICNGAHSHGMVRTPMTRGESEVEAAQEELDAARQLDWQAGLMRAWAGSIRFESDEQRRTFYDDVTKLIDAAKKVERERLMVLVEELIDAEVDEICYHGSYLHLCDAGDRKAQCLTQFKEASNDG